jgi:hypothetical protein
MNPKTLVVASAFVFGLTLFATTAPAAPPGVSEYVPPPGEQTTTDNGNAHGDAGVATPNGGPRGGDQCRRPRCRRLNTQQPVPSNHNNDITGGSGPLTSDTPSSDTPSIDAARQKCLQDCRNHGFTGAACLC